MYEFGLNIMGDLKALNGIEEEHKKMKSYIDYQFLIYFLFLKKEKCNWHNEVYWVFFLGVLCFSIWNKNGDIDTELGFHSYQS